MDITDVRVKLVGASGERLKAVCAVTFDGEFVVRDVKIVEGDEGFFVAMPSRKLSARCPKCRHKNQFRARYCEDCATKLPVHVVPADSDGRTRLYRDVAHPITPEFREKMQLRVIEAYQAACEEADQAPAEDAAERDQASAEDAAERDQASAEEVAEPDREVVRTEYDALIADLNGGSKSSSESERTGQERSGGRRQRHPAKSGPADRPGRRRRRGHREDSGEQRPADEEGKPVEAEAAAAGQGSVSVDRDGTSGDERIEGSTSLPAQEAPEPIDSETAAGVVEQGADDGVSREESAAGATPSQDADEDSAPFGMGIL